MSDRPKHQRAQALKVAEQLVAELAPACEKIEICGSIRRKRSEVSDAEIAFVPKFETLPTGFFETGKFALTDRIIAKWLADGTITKRLAINGRISSWGDDNKHAVHAASGIPVDLFAERDIRDWPRTLAIRTGPKDFNVRLMTMAPRHGHKAHAYGEALHKIPNGERAFAATEREFIEMCGLTYAEPEYRL